MDVLKLHLSDASFVYIFLIFFQMAVVLVFGLGIKRQRRKRRLKKRRHAELSRIWTEKVMDFSLGFLALDQIKKPTSYIDQLELQEILAEIMLSLDRQTRQLVAVVYEFLGFLDWDHRNLQSSKLSKQLKALLHIDLVQSDESLKQVNKLVNHRAPLVRFAVLRFIAKKEIESIQNLEKRIEDLTKLKRFDTVLEILNHLAIHHRPRFVQLLSSEAPFEVQEIFLKVLSYHKIREGIPFVQKSLEALIQANVRNMPLIKRHLWALTVQPDSVSEALLWKLSQDASLQIRFLALCSLTLLRPDLKDQIESSLKRETTPGLRESYMNFAVGFGRTIYG